MQAHRNHHGLTVRKNGPDELVFIEIGGDPDGEHSPLPASQEMGRLTLVGTARIDSVVRSDRDIDFLLRIAVEIAKKQVEASVRVLEPAFEGASNAGAGFVHRLERQRLRAQKRGETGNAAQEAQKKTQDAQETNVRLHH